MVVLATFQGAGMRTFSMSSTGDPMPSLGTRSLVPTTTNPHAASSFYFSVGGNLWASQDGDLASACPWQLPPLLSSFCPPPSHDVELPILTRFVFAPCLPKGAPPAVDVFDGIVYESFPPPHLSTEAVSSIFVSTRLLTLALVPCWNLHSLCRSWPSYLSFYPTFLVYALSFVSRTNLSYLRMEHTTYVATASASGRQAGSLVTYRSFDSGGATRGSATRHEAPQPDLYGSRS